MTVDDAYAVQGEWRRRAVSAGRLLVGHKIGLTSKAMQAATGIDEPDYGAIFDDMVYESGSVIEHGRFSTVRIEVELAFRLAEPVDGPDATLDDVLRATEYVVPALEILSSRIELAGRTIVDTISDNAAMGAMVVGDTASGRGTSTCAGSLRCCTATRPSRSPGRGRGAGPPGARRRVGWRTSSPSTATVSTPASWCSPARSPARSGSSRATPCWPTTATWGTITCRFV